MSLMLSAFIEMRTIAILFHTWESTLDLHHKCRFDLAKCSAMDEIGHKCTMNCQRLVVIHILNSLCRNPYRNFHIQQLQNYDRSISAFLFIQNHKIKSNANETAVPVFVHIQFSKLKKANGEIIRNWFFSLSVNALRREKKIYFSWTWRVHSNQLVKLLKNDKAIHYWLCML